MPYRFAFRYLRASDNQPHEFTCLLTCDRCTGTSKSGARCSRRVCIGLPLCWQHLLSEKHVRVRASTIPAAGKGLFAMLTGPQLKRTGRAAPVVFRKGDRILTYTGELIGHRELTRRYDDRSVHPPVEYTAPYTFELERVAPAAFVDSACQRGAASLVNHTNRARDANATFRAVGRGRQARIDLVALKAIRHGDEIFAHYGPAYLFDDGAQHATRYARR